MPFLWTIALSSLPWPSASECNHSTVNGIDQTSRALPEHNRYSINVGQTKLSPGVLVLTALKIIQDMKM